MSDEWNTRRDRIDRRTGKGVRYRREVDKDELPRGLQPVTPRRATLHGYPFSTTKFRKVYKQDSKVIDLKRLSEQDFNSIIDASERGLSSRWINDNLGIPSDISDYVREQIYFKYIQEKYPLTQDELAQIRDPFSNNRGRDFLFENMHAYEGDGWDRVLRRGDYDDTVPPGFKQVLGTSWDSMEYPSVFVLYPDGETHWGKQDEINYLDALDEFDVPYFVIRRTALYSAGGDRTILEGRLPQRVALYVHEDFAKFAHKIRDNIEHPWENVKHIPYWVKHFEKRDGLLDLWGKNAPTATLEDLREQQESDKRMALVMERLIKSGQFDFEKDTVAKIASEVEAIPPEERERLREEVEKKKMWGIAAPKGEEGGAGIHELDIEDVPEEELEAKEREKFK